MANSYDEGSLDRFSRALQVLKKDVDILYNPRKLPTPDPLAKYPVLTKPVSRAVRGIEKRSPRSPPATPASVGRSFSGSPQGQAEHELKNQSTKERDAKTSGGVDDDTKKFTIPGTIVPRSPLASERSPASRQRVEIPRSQTKNSSSRKVEGPEEKRDSSEEEREPPSRFSGVSVKMHPTLEQAVAAGSMAATSSGAGVPANLPMKCHVAIGYDSSDSEETASAGSPRENPQETSTPREQQQHNEPLATIYKRRPFEVSRSSPRNYALPNVKPPQFGKGSGNFPPPQSMMEMQRRMEEEWAERERRLRLQHERHTEAVVAQEVDKITQEYGRRLIFELQQQEKILQTQFEQQNTHGQLREATDANWRLQQQIKELQQKLEVTEHRQKAAEDDAHLLQQEAGNFASKIQHLKAENVFLSSQVAGLERQAFELKNKEEDLTRRLQIAHSNMEKVQEQLQHEQQVSASYAQRRKGLEKEIDALEHRRGFLEKQAQMAAAESVRYQGQTQALSAQNSQLMNENDALKRMTQRLEMKIKEQLDTESEGIAKDRKIEDLQELLEIQQKKSADVTNSLRMRVQHLERIEWLYSTLKNEVENLKLETHRLRDENATLLAEAKQRGQQTSTSQGEHRNMQNELLTAQRENYMLRKDIQKLLKAVSGGALPACLSTMAARDPYSNKTSPENTLPGAVKQEHGDGNKNSGGPCNGGECLNDPSIVPSQFADALNTRGPSTYSYHDDELAKYRQDVNNPTERSTCFPPCIPSASNPLVHSHEPSYLAKASAMSRWSSDIPAPGSPAGQTGTVLVTPMLLTEGADYADQMKSLEKQLLLLTAEKKRIEAELAKYPSISGRNARDRQKRCDLDNRLSEVDTTIHRIKMTIFQNERKHRH